MILFLGRRGRYEKLILISSLVLAVGLGVGCSNEKTKRLTNRKRSCAERKGINSEGCFNKANEAFKTKKM